MSKLPSKKVAVVGVFGMVCFVIGTPLAVWFVVLRHVKSMSAYELDPKYGACINFMIGPGEWVHRGHNWYSKEL